MADDKGLSELREYITDLKLIKSEIFKILEEEEKEISRAAKHYPGRINHLLVKRNIISARGLFPFFDLAVLQEREQDIDLIDLNIIKNDINHLEIVIRRIDRELEELQ